MRERQLVRQQTALLARDAWHHQIADNRQSALDRQAAVDRQAALDRQGALDRQATSDWQAVVEREAALDRQAALDRFAWNRQAAGDRRNATAAAAQPGAPAVLQATPDTAPGQSGQLITVRGIVVDGSIAGSLEALLAAADAAGLDLGGAGYRDPAAQRRLREQHCPDPVNSPPSACSPATARPGESMHEQGLAVDLTDGGSIIGSRDSAAYRWLAANAGRYGLINLPGEPWHWSTNGE